MVPVVRPEVEQPIPEPEGARQPLPELPDIRPGVNNEGHRKVIRFVLPVLRETMLSAEHCRKPPREQVRQSLHVVDQNGNRFWGQYLNFSRKRTVEDLILQFYYDTVRGTL